MKNGVTIWQVSNLLDHAFTVVRRVNDGWVPCRPIGRTDIKHRLKAAWLVFTGRADAVTWTDQ
jgi:hypothetical protein